MARNIILTVGYVIIVLLFTLMIPLIFVGCLAIGMLTGARHAGWRVRYGYRHSFEAYLKNIRGKDEQ